MTKEGTEETWYMAWPALRRISPVVVTRKTDQYVWTTKMGKVKKLTPDSGYSFFPTFEEAKAHMVQFFQGRVNEHKARMDAAADEVMRCGRLTLADLHFDE